MHLARCWASLVLAWLALPCAQAKQLRFNTVDDISMTRISDPRTTPSVPGSNVVWPSPNGRWAAIVTSRGVLSSDQIKSRILLFNLEVAERAVQVPGNPVPAPRVVASVVAAPYRLDTEAHAPVIRGLRWSSDSRTLYFKAVGQGGNYQLCSASIDGSGLHWLTPAGEDVGQFDIATETIVYTAADPGTHLIAPGRRINRDAIDITGARIQEVLFPHDIAARSTDLFRLYTLQIGQNPQKPQEAASYHLLDIPELQSEYPFRVSPGGKRLIKLYPPISVPQSWTAYTPIAGYGQLRLTHGDDRRLLRADNILRPLEFTVIDLRTGKQRPLISAPNARSLGYLGDANRTAWSQDAKHVLVTNTFLPVDPQNSENVKAKYPCAVARVDLSTSRLNCLYFEKGVIDRSAFHIQDVAFGATSDQALVLLHNGSGKQIVRLYAYLKGHWKLTSTQLLNNPVRSLLDLPHQGETNRPKVKVFVHQSLNDPPMLWMSDASGHRRVLWDPNPQFKGMLFGQASYYDWKDDSGRAWSGILVKPVGYVPGKRYPLVLQMYAYVKGQFVTSGLFPTAFAARELASAGFMVLQIQKQPDTLSERDPEIALEGYRSAIASLSRTGMIDPHRVGVVGFSWTCWYVIYALVHDPNLFAAATIADGLDYSYMQYKLFTVEYYPLERQMNKIRGGGPWAAYLQHWVQNASEFHLDRVRTPLRIEAINPSSVLQEWGIYSSLRLLHKPVDFIYFPRGTHIHQRPLEELESQQGNVDWLRFWLLGQEDPDPSKWPAYAPWEQMRRLQRAAIP